MRINQNIFAPQRPNIVQRAFLLFIVLLSFGTVASAQTPAPIPEMLPESATASLHTAALPSASPIIKDTPVAGSPTTSPSSPTKKSTTTTASAQKTPETLPREAPSVASADAYSASLKELSLLYEQEANRLAQENEKLKQLFVDGLISRVDLEASDKSLADVRARVETTQRQIAEANLKPMTAANLVMNEAANLRWTTGNHNIDNLIRYYGNENDLDPYLIFCLMNQESGFLARATSPKGAQGLMQLMPETAARYGVANPYDAAQSIRGGARYLKDLLKMFNGRLDLALAGYNAGEGAVIKYGYQIPPYSETRNYVRLISARYSHKGGG